MQERQPRQADGDGPPLLQLRAVSKSYGRGSQTVHVVRDVSLSVRAGETVWLKGESGSGKSSLLRIAGLLSAPDSGEVMFLGAAKGRDQRRSAALRREEIGFVFQQSNLLPELTVVDNIALAARHTDRASILALLDQFGLTAIADRKAKLLSGGESQRVAFCRAQLNDPSLLLADEPTSGLDETNARIILDHIARARDRGRAVLVASHDSTMASVADRVLVMEAGTLV